MNFVYEFIVLGVPHGQMRARAGKTRRGHSVVYKAGKQLEREETLLTQILMQLPRDHKPLDGPLGLVLLFELPRPKSHYGTGKNAGCLKKSAPEYPHLVVPDLDNLEKQVKDVFNSVVWKDDRQVCDVQKAKRYAIDHPKSKIAVYRL